MLKMVFFVFVSWYFVLTLPPHRCSQSQSLTVLFLLVLFLCCGGIFFYSILKYPWNLLAGQYCCCSCFKNNKKKKSDLKKKNNKKRGKYQFSRFHFSDMQHFEYCKEGEVATLLITQFSSCIYKSKRCFIDLVSLCHLQNFYYISWIH